MLPVELSVQVLTTGSWPTQASQQCALPRQLEAACAHFQRIYLAAHSGRRLTWQVRKVEVLWGLGRLGTDAGVEMGVHLLFCRNCINKALR